jgi:hypothetical protein
VDVPLVMQEGIKHPTRSQEPHASFVRLVYHLQPHRQRAAHARVENIKIKMQLLPSHA